MVLYVFLHRNLMDTGTSGGGEGRGKKEEKHTFMFTCRNRPFCLSALFCLASAFYLHLSSAFYLSGTNG